jgi:hypothetical protein
LFIGTANAYTLQKIPIWNLINQELNFHCRECFSAHTGKKNLPWSSGKKWHKYFYRLWPGIFLWTSRASQKFSVPARIFQCTVAPPPRQQRLPAYFAAILISGAKLVLLSRFTSEYCKCCDRYCLHLLLCVCTTDGVRYLGVHKFNFYKFL